MFRDMDIMNSLSFLVLLLTILKIDTVGLIGGDSNKIPFKEGEMGVKKVFSNSVNI